jgi:hypothetical protein
MQASGHGIVARPRLGPTMDLPFIAELLRSDLGEVTVHTRAAFDGNRTWCCSAPFKNPSPRSAVSYSAMSPGGDAHVTSPIVLRIGTPAHVEVVWALLTRLHASPTACAQCCRQGWMA